jgi:polypeptide N-acetylgalactosaminyltransferase
VEGANQAKGEVLTFLDSHCECSPGWLEPLLDRIKRNRFTIAMPVIDVIDQHTFEYYGGGAAEQRGIPTWSLQFSWLE